MTEDEKHLNLLSIFHYIVGGVIALFACIPLIHVGLGISMVIGALDGQNPPPQFVGWFFVLLGGAFVLGGWALAVAMIIAANKLKKRQSRTYCIVIAALECMMMPFGTILGIFTIIVLTEDSVKEIFAANN